MMHVHAYTRTGAHAQAHMHVRMDAHHGASTYDPNTACSVSVPAGLLVLPSAVGGCPIILIVRRTQTRLELMTSPLLANFL